MKSLIHLSFCTMKFNFTIISSLNMTKVILIIIIKLSALDTKIYNQYTIPGYEQHNSDFDLNLCYMKMSKD